MTPAVSWARWCALGLILGACSDPSGNEPFPWTLVWQDEFDGAAGTPPDPGRWQHDIGTDWGNAQLEYDTDRPENASLDGAGHLAITARAEPYLGQNYTSARITTEGRFELTYGRVEARIKLPVGQGIWPAFWLLGANLDTVGWPASGEIDIMEYRGQEPTVNHGTLHGPGYSGAGGITQRLELPRGRFDTDFHVFAIEWAADRVDWFVDDSLYHSVQSTEVPGAWAFDHPFYIILNVAVGGGWVGPPNAFTTFPQTMLIDWVRVYESAP